MTPVEKILGSGGELEDQIKGFVPRSQQVEMAEAVSETLVSGGILVCEAGTGTGKTFAYLVPALLSGLKVIISTGTRNLQDQLYKRDLPRIRQAVGIDERTALLKGRSNYLCLYRMDRAQSDRRSSSPVVDAQLQEVRGWAGKTVHGDIAELPGIPEDALVWPLVTSTIDNCLGAECPDYTNCFLVEARKRAQEADVVVINHHLLCADFSLKEEGFGELLPIADAFIIDEAHQLPEVANNFFGTSVTGKQLQELARDTMTAYRQSKLKQAEISDAVNVLEKAVRDFRLLFGVEERREPWFKFQSDKRLVSGLDSVMDALDELAAILEAAGESDEGLGACGERAAVLLAQLGKIASDEEADNSVRWWETTRLGFRLSLTPLEIADAFQTQMQRHANAWVFTSATLAVGEDFGHFCRQLGLEEVRTEMWESPFDYQSQAIWFVPEGLLEPADPGFVPMLIEAVQPVIDASGGRTFLLFTSYRALREAESLFPEDYPYPLLVQGSAPKNELLDEFRRLGNAVLLATGSFWEGVDVQGDALSVVVIDKLPFASPGDPVLQARLDALREKGRNPFMEYQVPQAVIALKQGAGRLIRGESDKGVLITCDPRLLTKPYGRTFIRSMPAFFRTRELDAVLEFFK